MLRFLAHLMRTRLPQLSRYLDMSLATSCDLPPSHDPSALTPAGYEHPRPPQARSCYQPPSHGPQDQEYRTGPLHPPPILHLPALKEFKPAMPPHRLPYMMDLEKTKLVMPLRLPLYANVGYEQHRPPHVTSCVQPPSHGQQDQGYRTRSRAPPPSSTPPSCEQATNSLDPTKSPPRALIQGYRGTGCVHSLPLPTLSSSQLRARYEQPRSPQDAPISHGPQDEPRPPGPRAAVLRTSHGHQYFELRTALTHIGCPHEPILAGRATTLRAAPSTSYERATISLDIIKLCPRPTAPPKKLLVTSGDLTLSHDPSTSAPTGYKQT